MKCITQKNDLLRAVNVASRLASTRSTLPILQNVYIAADDKTLSIRSTDLDQTIEVTLNAEISEQGVITVPARLLLDYLQNNSDERITLNLEDTTLSVRSTNHSAKIKGLAAEDYPTLPQVKAEKEVEIDSAQLVEVIGRCSFAAASDDTRPILTGLLFRFEGNKLTVVATDGYRLAKSELGVESNITGDFIIPRRSLLELQRFVGEGRIKLIFSNSQAQFKTDGICFTARLLDGSFPAFDAIIPKERSFVLSMASTALLQSLKLASLFSRDSAYSTKLEIDGSKLKVTAISPQLGENSNDIPLEKAQEKPFTISANAQYLIDVLNVLSGEIELSFNSATSPIVITRPSDKGYLYLVMPLRSE